MGGCDLFNLLFLFWGVAFYAVVMCDGDIMKEGSDAVLVLR